nr:MAG TPA: hypothetical protein [Caudoviricetes sp.]
MTDILYLYYILITAPCIYDGGVQPTQRIEVNIRRCTFNNHTLITDQTRLIQILSIYPPSYPESLS